MRFRNGRPLRGFALAGRSTYHAAMPRKPLDLPLAVARAFVKDMRAFHAAETGFERDEVAARQLHALQEHQRPGEKKLRLTDVHELFSAMKDHVLAGRPHGT
jgi:hypothetical protein